MLTASAFLFLFLNLAPSPTLRLLHHNAPSACFAVAAAADAPGSLRGLQNTNNNAGNNHNPSFASLVWGNSLQQNNTTNAANDNANNANQTTLGLQQQHQDPNSHNANNNNDDACYMIHLEMVNSSTWRDPSGTTFYQAEYHASNTAMRDICDVKIGIPTGNIDPSQVTVNNSYAMKVDTFSFRAANRGSGEQGPMLTATLQPPYFHPGVRIREAVDMGFVLQGPSPGIAGTGQATVLSARYCTEEESRASVPPPNQHQQQQQQQQAPQQQQGPGPQQNEQENEDGRTWPIRAANLIQRWRQGGDE